MRLIDADALKVEILHRRRQAKTLTGVDMLMLIEDFPTVNGWISVKDRLPERKEYLHESNVIRNSSEYVLVYVSASFPYERMFVTVARYDYDKHWPRWVIRSSHNGVVTHWMPLPEPPEEE